MNGSLDFLYHVLREQDSTIDYHIHASFEIVYYVTGSGTTQIGKTVYEYGPGTFAIIAPRTRHNEIRRTQTEVLFACFSFEEAPFKLLNGLYADPERRLERLLRAIQDELGSRQPYADLAIAGLLQLAIAQMGRLTTAASPAVAGSEKTSYAIRYFEQYFAETIDLQAIAASLGYSYDHFRHFFKSETGYSPTQFVIRKRVEMAKQLLLQSAASMTAIAHECGFSNAQQFSMIFRKHTDLTPTEYRRHHQFV